MQLLQVPDRETFETLVETSRTDDGRSLLASQNTLTDVLHLTQSLLPSSDHHRHLLFLSLKLLRNLCAGEISNQNSFVDQNGVGLVSGILKGLRQSSDPDIEVIRMGLQVLANVCLSGEEKHQLPVWEGLFPEDFVELAGIRKREICDPLCLIIYVCSDGRPGLSEELCGKKGLFVLAEIVKTASLVGFGEDWLKLVLSRVCLEDVHFPRLFAALDCDSDNSEDFNSSRFLYSAEQAYLLSMVSEILTERIEEIAAPIDLAVCVFRIFKRSTGIVDFELRGQSGVSIDVLRYSLTILRDACAQDSSSGRGKDSMDVVDTLISHGLLELLLCLLRDLEPPAIIRKVRRQSEDQEAASTLNFLKVCPYKGFRRDIVAVIGNCAFRRKHVQDEIREKNGILLMLQQCVVDEDNPFLREWGISAVRNLLEGNAANQQAVAELELQGSVDVPELANLGLRVEVDQKSGRTKLVNIS